MTIKQSAGYLQLSERSLRRYLNSGLLPRRGTVGTVRIDKLDLDALMFFGKRWKRLTGRQKDEVKAMDL